MAKIIFVDLSTPKEHSLLEVERECIPRVGEWIEMDCESKGMSLYYEVLQVAHSTKYNGTDVFVGNPQPETEARQNLHRQTLKKYSS
jgi:hypothetical protein